MAKGGADGRNDHQIDRLAGGRIRARWRSWHVTGWRRSPKCCGGLLFVFGGHPPGSAGVPPASLYLQTACHPRPLPCKAHQTRLYGDALPSCRSLCGRDARAPGWSFFTSRNASTASMAKGGADGRNDHQIDRLAGGRIRARWRSWQVTGWRRSVAAGSCVFGGQSTRERGRPARILIPANSLPSKATPLQGAPNPPLRGALPSCRRAPRWSLCGSRRSTASMAKGGADGRNDHQIDRLAGGRIRARWRSWHVTGWRRSPKCCGGFLFVFGGQSTRERGRPARILIPANSLPSKATPLQGAPNPPLRGSLPSCQGAGGTPALPGGSLCGRDARAPGWSFFTSRSASTASMAKGGADGRNDHQIDRLAGGRIRARWRSWQVTGWRRSPKCCGGLLFVFGGQSTRERGRPARILIPANSLPSKATPLQGAPNPPLRGALPSCRVAGADAALCAGETPALPGGLSSRAVVPPPRAWPKAALMAVTTIKSTGWRSNPCALEELARHWMASKSEVLRRVPVCVRWAIHPGARASRPHPYTCKQPAIPHQTRLYVVLFHRCAGGTPALPGGLCAGGTPALPALPTWGVTPSPRPTLGGSLSSILQRLSGPLAVLSGPSWISFLSLGVLRGCPSWISYVSWLCSSATISRATSRPRSGWPGGREMAATTGWPPPP